MANSFSSLLQGAENGVGNFFNNLGTATGFQRPNTPGLMAKPTSTQINTKAGQNVANNTGTYSLNGQTYNSAGDVVAPAKTNSTGSNGLLGSVVNKTGVSTSKSNDGSQNNQPVVTPPVTTPLYNPKTDGTPFTNAMNTGGAGLWASVVGNSANTQPSQGTQNAQGLLQGIAQNGSPQVQQQNQNVQGLLNVQNEIANNPNLAAEVASGRGQAISGEINAAQTGVQNALAQQNQQITAGNEAGGLANTAQSNQLTGQANAIAATQPQLSQYGQTYYQPSQAGQSGGGNIQLTGQPATDLQTAINAVKNGADYNTQYNQLSSAYGAAVANQLQQGLGAGSNFNPTQQSATSNAVAGQNAGTTADYSKRATDLSANIQTISAQAPLLISAIKSAGLNTAGNETLNQLMSSGLQQTNPGAVKAIQGYVQEVNTAVQQMVGRGGVNPTQVGLQAGNLDISNLPVSQLESVFDNLQKTGQATQGVYQNIANESGGGGASKAYMGGNVTPQTTATPVQGQQIQPNTVGADNNIVLGAGSQLVGGAWNSVKNLGGELIGWLAAL